MRLTEQNSTPHFFLLLQLCKPSSWKLSLTDIYDVGPSICSLDSIWQLLGLFYKLSPGCKSRTWGFPFFLKVQKVVHGKIHLIVVSRNVFVVKLVSTSKLTRGGRRVTWLAVTFLIVPPDFAVPRVETFFFWMVIKCLFLEIIKCSEELKRWLSVLAGASSAFTHWIVWGCPPQVWRLLWSRQSYQGQSCLMKFEQHRAALESISHWRTSRFKRGLEKMLPLLRVAS